MASGTALVLLTWLAAAVCCVLVGLPFALTTSTGSVSWADVRRGAWWGLLAITVLAYLLNLVAPLASPAVALVVLGTAAVAGVLTTLLVRRRGWRPQLTVSRGTLVLGIAGGLAVAYLAVAALGPVTNYDSGLYHLGAIGYAADYATVPGLANLFFALGYGNAEFPLAALFSNGPWGGEGFRLLNGFVIALVVIDLIVRSAERRRGAGFPVLAAGTLALLVPMIALADYWVTSPSQDSAVFAVTVAASAAITSAVAGGRNWVAEAASACALGVLLTLLRPTMAAFTIVTVLVILLLRWRRGRPRSVPFARSATLVVGMGLLAGAAATMRDYLLSGWLQYPLSVLSFDVPWVAPDPTNDRIATLGYHRDPGNLWDAAHGWEWIGPWLARLPQMWEAYAAAAAGAVTVMALVLAHRTAAGLRVRGLLLAMAPSVMMTGAWFVATPPSFRFAWGPVFTCLTIPLGWALWRLTRGSGAPGAQRTQRWSAVIVVAVAVPVLLVTLYSATVRLDTQAMSESRQWALVVTIPYAVAPLPEIDTTDVALGEGLVVRVPTSGEQCWSEFPLCTPRTPQTLRYLEPTRGIAGGFEQ